MLPAKDLRGAQWQLGGVEYGVAETEGYSSKGKREVFGAKIAAVEQSKKLGMLVEHIEDALLAAAEGLESTWGIGSVHSPSCRSFSRVE